MYTVEAIVGKKIDRKTSKTCPLCRTADVYDQMGRLLIETKYMGTPRTLSIP